MNYTSIEQSKKLLELGLNPETADMAIEFGQAGILHNHNFNIERWKSLICLDFYPCWSVGALLEMIPNGVVAHIDEKDGIFWYCNTTHYGEDFYDYGSSYHDNPIGAIIETIVWLLENGYIKKVKE